MANNKSLQFLRGTQSQISSSTEVALAGQPVFATDTNQLYIGDDSTQIKNLTPVNTEGSYPTLGAGQLTVPMPLGNGTDAVINGYYKIASAEIASNTWGEATAFFLISSPNRANNFKDSCLIQCTFRGQGTAESQVYVALLAGSREFLERLYISYVAVESTLPLNADLYLYTNNQTWQDISIKLLYSTNRLGNTIDIWTVPKTNPTVITSLPSGAVNTQLSSIVNLITEAATAETANSLTDVQIVSNSSNPAGWYKFAEIRSTNTGTYSIGASFYVDGVSPDNTENIGERNTDGILNIEARCTSDVWSVAVSFVAGYLSSNNFVAVPVTEGVDVYVNLPTLWWAYKITLLSKAVFSEVDYTVELTNTYYGTSAPSGAVYAVVRNNASGDEDGNNISNTYAKQNGTYEDLFSGGMQAETLAEGADLNDCVPAKGGRLQAWYCNGSATSNTIINCPMQGVINSTFYLTALKTWHGAEETQYRVTQTLYRANPGGLLQLFVRSVDRGGSATAAWGAWHACAFTDGSYPTLGAGHLQDFLVENTAGTSGVGWWHILSIPSSKLSTQGAYSLIFLINEVYDRAEEGQGQSGLLEIDLQTLSSNNGISYASVNILGGNLSSSQICITFNNLQADVYYYLDSVYEATIWTRLSEGLEGGQVEPRYNINTFFYGTSAPSGAVYAVNRNVAAKGVTPATSSDSDDVATTEWVRDSLISIGESITDSHIISTTTTCFTGPTGKLCTTRGSAIVSDLCGDNESIYSCSAITANLTVSTTADKKGVSLSYVTTSKGGNDGTGTVTAKFTYRKATLGELGQLIADTIG